MNKQTSEIIKNLKAAPDPKFLAQVMRKHIANAEQEIAINRTLMTSAPLWAETWINSTKRQTKYIANVNAALAACGL